MSELAAFTGALVKVINCSAYGFDRPRGSPRTAPTCGSPTEVVNGQRNWTASTGALVKLITGSTYSFDHPDRRVLGRHPRVGRKPSQLRLLGDRGCSASTGRPRAGHPGFELRVQRIPTASPPTGLMCGSPITEPTAPPGLALTR